MAAAIGVRTDYTAADLRRFARRCGDQEVRTALYEAANNILTRPVKGSQLKSWAAKVACRAGMKPAT